MQLLVGRLAQVCQFQYVKLILLVVVLFNFYIAGTTGMSWRAISGQVRRSPLRTGNKFACIVPPPRGSYRGLKGDCVGLSRCLAALQDPQTKQDVVI